MNATIYWEFGKCVIIYFRWDVRASLLCLSIRKLHVNALLCLFQHSAMKVAASLTVINIHWHYCHAYFHSEDEYLPICSQKWVSSGGEGYWPDPGEVTGRWVGFGTAGELHIVLTHVPTFVNPRYGHHRCDCTTKWKNKKGEDVEHLHHSRRTKAHCVILLPQIGCADQNVFYFYFKGVKVEDSIISHREPGSLMTNELFQKEQSVHYKHSSERWQKQRQSRTGAGYSICWWTSAKRTNKWPRVGGKLENDRLSQTVDELQLIINSSASPWQRRRRRKNKRKQEDA